MDHGLWQADCSLLSHVDNDDGYVDLANLIQHRHNVEDRCQDDRMLEEEEESTSEEIEDGKKRERVKKPFRRRAKRSTNLFVIDDDGKVCPALPEDSQWFRMYVKHPAISSKKFCRNFRNRFRMPYAQFIQLWEDAREGCWFPRWMKPNSKTPLSLLILGALRYLGRGWTFDDLEENTCISQEVHRTFFHEFISIGSLILYEEYVQQPSMDDVNRHQVEFDQAGFTGAIGSTDATHIIIEKCTYR